jgi:hypothetical protein
VKFTNQEFVASVRENYQEMQELFKQVHGEIVTYPDYEAALDFVEKNGLPDALSLEKQYSESLGRLAQLSDIVCAWVLQPTGKPRPGEVIKAATEIMEYVDAVRP